VGVSNTDGCVFITRVCVSNTRAGVSNTRTGVSNTDGDVSNTDGCVSKTAMGVSNTDVGVSLNQVVLPHKCLPPEELLPGGSGMVQPHTLHPTPFPKSIHSSHVLP